MLRQLLIGLPRGGRYGISLLMSVFQGLCAIALLGSSAWLISRAAEHPPIMYLSIAIVGVRAFALGRAAFRYAERWLSHDAVMQTITSRRSKIFSKLIPLSPAGFGRLSMGDLSSRVISDVDELQNLPLRVIGPLVHSVLVSAISIALFIWILPSAVPVLSISLLLALLLSLPLANLIAAKYDRENSILRAEFVADSLNLIANSELLVAYDWFKSEFSNLEKLQAKINQRSRVQAAVVGLGLSAFSFAGTGCSLAVMWLGYQEILSGRQHPVMLAVFALLPLGIFDVAAGAQPVVANWRRFKSSADRLIQIEDQDTPVDINLKFGSKELSHVESLELKKVALGYPSGPDIVKDFDLSIPAGESVALIGQSGAGKTTVGLALSNFLNPRRGHFHINRQDASLFSESSLRKRIGLLEQSPYIFDGSLKDNLLLANESSSDDELKNALVKVKLWSTFADRGGLDCKLGENGVLISGGEAQRLAMARALIADFDVLILDEPTANVSPVQSQSLIKDFLEFVQNGKIMVLITHDQELAKLVSRVVKI